MFNRNHAVFALTVALGLAVSACSEAATTAPSGSAANSTKPATSTKPTTSAKPATSASSAPATSSSAAASTPEAGPDLKVIAMKITFEKETLEIKEDGAVMLAGKEIAKFVKNELKSSDGKHVVSVAKDGSIWFDGKNEKGVKFDEKDAVVSNDKKGGLTIADDGKVTLLKEDGTPEKAVIKIEGFKPEARRAACIALLVSILTAAGEPSSPPAISASAAVSAGPAPAPKK